MVGLPGLEPGTSVLSGLRSNHLSYRPIFMGLATKFTLFLPFLQVTKNVLTTFLTTFFKKTLDFVTNNYYTQ